MEIEKSSKFIKSLYEDDEDVDLDTLDYKFEIKMLFDTFSNNRRFSIDFDNVTDFFDRFNKLHKNGIFVKFKPPLAQEYLCNQLNLLLIIDFILTFFRADNNLFDVTKINTQFIFDFFIRLGEFYNFVNYLDVDECFVNYLKYMMVLYAFQLDRNIIEDKYCYFIEILDDFFRNDIMLQVFSDIKYKEINVLSNQIKMYENTFDNEIKYYDNKVCYDSDDYLYLDELFSMSYSYKVTIKNTIIEVLNPEPQPVYLEAQANIDNIDNNVNYDLNNAYWRTHTWKPTINKQVPVIENHHTNYEEYKKLFVLRKYKTIKIKYDNVKKEILSMCAPLKLKKYDAFEQANTSIEILKVKTILGCIQDYSHLSDCVCNLIFGLACEYGHIDIVKLLIEKKSGDIDDYLFEKAQSSPNRDIPKYLLDCKKKYKKLDELFTQYKDANYYEPKIKFN